MLKILAVQAILALAGAQPPALDTVIPVARGARLDLHAGVGTARVQVRTWDRDAVGIEVPISVSVSTTGGLVRVVATQPPRGGAQVTYDVRVPVWLPVSLNGVQAAISVEGTASDVSVETVRGSVQIVGGNGRIAVRSVEGAVTVEGARGRIEASSVNQNVRVSRSSGEVHAETVNGSVTLDRVESAELYASAVNGSVDFVGPILNGGRYRLSSHNGRVRVSVQEAANATATVSTYNGEFRSAFPISLTGTSGDRRRTFVIGTGSARIEASSFNGNVEFVRPGAP